VHGDAYGLAHQDECHRGRCSLPQVTPSRATAVLGPDVGSRNDAAKTSCQLASFLAGGVAGFAGSAASRPKRGSVRCSSMRKYHPEPQWDPPLRADRRSQIQRKSHPSRFRPGMQGNCASPLDRALVFCRARAPGRSIPPETGKLPRPDSAVEIRANQEDHAVTDRAIGDIAPRWALGLNARICGIRCR
jgi:hypothetical protein